MTQRALAQAAPQTAAAPAKAATGVLQRKCACGTHTVAGGECAACEKEKAFGKMQRAANSHEPVDEVPEVVHEVLRSGGQPLDEKTRAFMEPRFGYDFSSVRVHTGARAAESAQAVNARAYTLGTSVVFGAGQYAPSTHAGQRLLAHELTHVMQQSGQSGSVAREAVEIGPAEDHYEREADAYSERIVTATESGAESAAEVTRLPVASVRTARIQRSFWSELGGIGGGIVAGAIIGGLIGGWMGALVGGILGLIGGAILVDLLRDKRASGKVQMLSGRYVGDVEGSVNNLREEVLAAMDRMHILWAMPDADYNVEYPAVSALPAGSSVPKKSIPKTIAAIKRLADPVLPPEVARTVLDLNLKGSVGQGQTNNRDDILALQDALHVDWNLSNDDYARERGAVNSSKTPNIPNQLIPTTIEGIPKMKSAFVAGAIRQDLFTGTKAVTQTKQANVEHILNPTTTVVVPPPPVGGAPPPPPIVVDPPAMTDTGPGGKFETEMLDMLKKNVGGWASAFRTLKGESGQPAFPISKGNDIAVEAQGEVERYYAPYLRTASRGVADKYHPGKYSLTEKLGDESTRPINDPVRRGWMEYWMTLRSPNCLVPPCGQAILDAHKYVGRRDIAELRRVRDLYMSVPANVTDIDDTIHSWGAEAGTGTVFIQPYQRLPNETEKRKKRWELFTTLIHEMMHIVTHPNYARAADIIGGTGRKILIEGFAEVFRSELWFGPGQLKARLATPEMAPLRKQVEGASYAYDPSVVVDGNFYDQLADADKIDKEVGRENSKAAFFLGHVELMGLGAGTRTEGGSLAGVAMYEPSDSANAEVVIPIVGDTYASLLERTGAAPGELLDDATGTPLAPDAAIGAGTRVRVPGIRWVRAISNDTLGNVARQHHVTVAALAKANWMAEATPATTPLVVGTRVLIPKHKNLP
ncbi:MAG: DUF4157 domain-containing protein [Pyrinomonadaceae bacterium]|nr:DUF4157 domain-containing protein [Pyrinomonadaceae bacterium]